MSEDRFARIDDKLHMLVAGQAGIDKRLDKVEITQQAMRDDIKQIAEGHGATQAAIERATQVVCDHIDTRIKAIEDMVRVHFGTTP